VIQTQRMGQAFKHTRGAMAGVRLGGTGGK
jgi:hypothetical protein